MAHQPAVAEGSQTSLYSSSEQNIPPYGSLHPTATEEEEQQLRLVTSGQDARRSSEFANEPVPECRQMSWVRAALPFAAGALSIPTYVAGIDVSVAAKPVQAASAILAGNILLSVLGSLIGSIGARTRLSSYLLSRVAFGIRGAAIINVTFALSLLGWFGVNICIFSGAVRRLLDAGCDAVTIEKCGASFIPTGVINTGAGIVMTITATCGLGAISALSALLVPILGFVTALLIKQALSNQSFNDMVRNADARGVDTRLDFGDATSSMVGAAIVGAIIMPDITRFIRWWPGAICAAILSYAIVSSTVQGAGALAALSFGDDGLLDIMMAVGLHWAAFTILIAGTWVLNSLNLYSAALSVEATVPAIETRLLTVVLGALGTLFAFFGILESFLAFLFFLSLVFSPIAGVILVDYLVLRRNAYHVHRLELEVQVIPSALLSWAIGFTFAALGSTNGIINFTGVAAMDAIVTAGAAYFVLGMFDRNSRRSEA